MPAIVKTKEKQEFGDFQTPIELAEDVCRLLFEGGLRPAAALEPTCGVGNFLRAFLKTFPDAERVVGVELNREYVGHARRLVDDLAAGARVSIIEGDFFKLDWATVVGSLPDPLLILGNPPWVTNADLGNLKSRNLPKKSNFQMRRGIDALMGHSNFDISEWMLVQTLDWVANRNATVAMLCKTAVARRVLLHAWRFSHKLGFSAIYEIDAVRYFGAMVDACLLVMESSTRISRYDCPVYADLRHSEPKSVLGFRKGHLAADIRHFDRWSHLEGTEWYKWRSGIKHDCSKVMEFTKKNNAYQNGFGEFADLEEEYLYPMLKSADLAHACAPSRWMLVPQRSAQEDTAELMYKAPSIWRYLERHAKLLDGRSSSIYRKRPRFSVFGVGDYTFAFWKVATSGFYKKLDFKVVGPHGGRPVVLDDTCYFLACHSYEEATLLSRLLNSDIAKEFFLSQVFWDSKRPITAALLRRLDLLLVAREMNLERDLRKYLHPQPRPPKESFQLRLKLIPTSVTRVGEM
ncbi:MAG: class I SAM-dependent methyltransferase [Desulfomonilaceae bacterium]